MIAGNADEAAAAALAGYQASRERQDSPAEGQPMSAESTLQSYVPDPPGDARSTV